MNKLKLNLKVRHVHISRALLCLLSASDKVIMSSGRGLSGRAINKESPISYLVLTVVLDLVHNLRFVVYFAKTAAFLRN